MASRKEFEKQQANNIQAIKADSTNSNSNLGLSVIDALGQLSYIYQYESYKRTRLLQSSFVTIAFLCAFITYSTLMRAFVYGDPEDFWVSIGIATVWFVATVVNINTWWTWRKIGNDMQEDIQDTYDAFAKV